MPSTIAHSFIGLTLGVAWLLPRCSGLRALWEQIWLFRGHLLFCVILANAPDVDYLFGIGRGNLNYYHHAITHTLVWVLTVAVVLWAYGYFFGRTRPGPAFILILLLLGSHLAADFLCADHSSPYGIMLAWPFSSDYYLSPKTVFMAVSKASWRDLFTFYNLKVIGLETLLTFPLLAAVLLYKLLIGRRRGF